MVSASRRRGATVCPLKLHDPGIAQGLFACVPMASTSAAKAAACAKPAMMMDVLPPQPASRYIPMMSLYMSCQRVLVESPFWSAVSRGVRRLTIAGPDSGRRRVRSVHDSTPAMQGCPSGV